MKAEILAAIAELKALVEQLPDAAPVPEPAPAPTPVTPPSADIIVTGDQKHTRFYRSGLAAGTTIDLSKATFAFDNDPATPEEQRINVDIIKSPGVSISGGRINGSVDLNKDWSSTYIDGSAFRIIQCPDFAIQNARADRCWDAIHLRDNSGNFALRTLHFSNMRDDMIENDWQYGGLIENCLLDGAQSIISLDPYSAVPAGVVGRNNKIILRNVLGRCQLANQGGTMTHGPVFKCDVDYSESQDSNPVTEHYDCVYAIETPTHLSYSRHKRWVLKAKGFGSCFYLNLSDKPLPSYYTALPQGFTYLQGSAAREKWAAVKADWLAKNPGLA